jgi:hypothetical protein
VLLDRMVISETTAEEILQSLLEAESIGMQEFLARILEDLFIHASRDFRKRAET